MAASLTPETGELAGAVEAQNVPDRSTLKRPRCDTDVALRSADRGQRCSGAYRRCKLMGQGARYSSRDCNCSHRGANAVVIQLTGVYAESPAYPTVSPHRARPKHGSTIYGPRRIPIWRRSVPCLRPALSQ
jgi:hypothetical protein